MAVDFTCEIYSVTCLIRMCFWRRAPKIHARQLLEQHTLAQDKRGSKARPEASSNSKECLKPTPVVKSRFQAWDA